MYLIHTRFHISDMAAAEVKVETTAYDAAQNGSKKKGRRRKKQIIVHKPLQATSRSSAAASESSNTVDQNASQKPPESGSDWTPERTAPTATRPFSDQTDA